MKDRHGRSRRRGQGELAAQVLAALAAAPGPVSAAWVRERIGGDLAYTTVVTTLSRLLAKGAVRRRKAGRSFAWSPAADEAGLAALRMRRVLDGETDRKAVLASFVTVLSPDDERLLRGLLGELDDVPGPSVPGPNVPGPRGSGPGVPRQDTNGQDGDGQDRNGPHGAAERAPG